MELDAAVSAVEESDQAQEISMMTRSSIMAMKEGNIWKIAQEEHSII